MPDQEEFKEYMPRKAGLSHGAKGADVKRLQHYLKNFGYLRDPKPSKDDAFAPLKAAALVPAEAVIPPITHAASAATTLAQKPAVLRVILDSLRVGPSAFTSGSLCMDSWC